MKKKEFVVIALGTLALLACSSEEKKYQAPAELSKAHAELTTPELKSLGTLDFEETKEGIKVKIAVTGLKPKSTHGLHIHEKGECEGPDFESAGPHFNPKNTPHGGPTSPERHPGDFGNVTSDAKGVATKEVLIAKDMLNGLGDIKGKAVIIHKKADDLKSQPSGDSGPRMACGIIR